MKKTFVIGALAVCAALVPSCANWANPNAVSAASVGSAAEVLSGTVVSVRNVRIDASQSDKNLGTGVGAAIGVGAGQLLGRGKGQAVSAIGFGTLGALAGRGVSKYANQADGQELSIKIDRTGKVYRVTQPVYRGIGPISVGTHGNVEIGSGTSKFVPDGF